MNPSIERDKENDDESWMSSVRWIVDTLVHGSKLSSTNIIFISFLAGREFLQPLLGSRRTIEFGCLEMT